MKDHVQAPPAPESARDDLVARLLAEEGVETAEERIPEREGSGPAPLSFAQERLWFLDRLEPGNPMYHVHVSVLLEGPLDLAAVGETFRAVVERHEVLRTRFVTVGGRPVQEPVPEARVPFSFVDLSHLPPAEGEEAARRGLAAAFAQPFDLSRGPLLRVFVARLAPERHAVGIVVHHIVSDRWSREVFVSEVATLYRSFAAGEPPTVLPPLPIQYADFATWQRSWLTGDVLEEQVDYWRERLEGVPNLELPTDRPRPEVQDYRGAQLPVELPRDAADELRRWAEARDGTFFMTLAAVFFAFLHRHTGQDDLAIGSPIANRTRPELENLIGYFVNTLVLRVPVRGADSFADLLARVREVAVGAYGHQDLPFERLLEELEIQRGLSRTPLFQAALVLQNVPRRHHHFADIDLTPFQVEDGTAKFDLTLTFEDSPGGLEGSIQYASALFDEATGERFARRFGVLLEAMALEPERPLGELAVLTPEERTQLLEEWPERRPAPASGDTLPELFLRHAEETPYACALTYGGRTVSYGALARRVHRLAHLLRDAGVGAEVRVGLSLDPSIDLVVGLLAILEAGGAYVPIDPSLPEERLDLIRRDSGIRLLVTDREPESLPGGVEAIRLDLPDEGPADGPAGAPEPVATQESAAYVIYTSGSTGRPKGVVVTHRNAVRLLATTEEAFDFGPEDVWTLFHSFAFDFSVWELWGALAYGGRLVVVPPLVARSPEELRELLLTERVTVLNQTPSAFRLLVGVDAAVGNGAGPYALRWVVFGGEALELESLRPWFERHGDREPTLVNMYGITETTVHVTCRELSRGDLEHVDRSPIGRAIGDLGLYVLDAAGRPAPIGVPGELHVAGDGLARGYLERPGLTAERFVPDSFASEPGVRLYRSGDLGRRRPDGDVDHLGRVDDQVKVRGFRIELGEVQAAMSAHPGVRQAVVRTIAAGDGEARMVGYLVAEGAEAPGAERLREHMLSKLPSYMVPASFVAVDSIPLTGNGKVDFDGLPLPDADRSDLAERYVAPRTPVEERLAAVWREVLGLDRVGVRDNFFVLGGDSLLAVRVLALAGEAGIDLSLQRLFQAQTIAELARELEGADAEDPVTEPEPAPELPELEPFQMVSAADRDQLPQRLEDAYPLTNLQAGMLYHMQLEPDRPVYHNVNSYHLRLPFDEAAFRRAVALVVERHPILRTGFDLLRFSEPLQLVHREAEADLGVDDLRDLDAAEQVWALTEFTRAEAGRRFDPEHPPLIRFHVHRRTDESFQFTLTEFHPILDGWSLQSTLTEIFGHYVAMVEGGEPEPRPPLKSSLRDYVYLERQAARSEGSREFWTRWLADAPFTALPPRSEEPEDGELDGLRVARPDTPIPEELSDRLQDFAREAGVPIKSVLLAAHLKVLSELSGRDDVVGGLASHGRIETEGGDDVRGLFLNSLPFRFALEPGSWEQLLQSVFANELELLPHRRFPLVSMQTAGGGQALFDTQFNYVHFHVLRDVFGGRDVLVDEVTSLNVEETHFCLVAGFGSDPVSGRIYLHLYCDRGRFSDEQAAAAARCYLETLEAIARDPGARHEELDLLAPVEEARFPVAAADPETSIGDVATRLAGWARSLPRHEGLAWDGVALTFAELDQRVAREAGKGAGGTEEPAAGPAVDPDGLIRTLGTLRAGAAVTPPGAATTFTRSQAAAVLDTLQELHALGASDRVLAVGPAEAWACAWPVLLWPTAVGASLILGAVEAAAEGRDEPPTVVLCPVSHARELVRALADAPAGSRPGRAFFFGREPLPPGFARRLAEELDVAATSVVRLAQEHWLLAASGPDRESLAIHPLASPELREVTVVGPFGRPVPRGIVGDLTINDEATGRLARFLGRGEIELLEPPEERVKVNGRRIELRRISHFLSLMPGVDDAAVRVTDLDAPRPRVTAWAVASPGADPDPAELMRHLRARFAPPSVPGTVEWIDALPLHPDGSVVRAELPEPRPTLAEENRGVAPRNELEESILRVWRQILGTDAVGVKENFFDLGGHSLQMLQAHQKLQAALERQIPLMSHFRFPTVESLAEFLSGAMEDPDFDAQEERGQQRAGRMHRRRAMRRRRTDPSDDSTKRENPKPGVP